MSAARPDGERVVSSAGELAQVLAELDRAHPGRLRHVIFLPAASPEEKIVVVVEARQKDPLGLWFELCAFLRAEGVPWRGDGA